jgi:hypothetical protein
VAARRRATTQGRPYEPLAIRIIKQKYEKYEKSAKKT